MRRLQDLLRLCPGSALVVCNPEEATGQQRRDKIECEPTMQATHHDLGVWSTLLAAISCHVEEIICFILAHQLSSCMHAPARHLYSSGSQLLILLEAGHTAGSGSNPAGLTLNLSSNNPFRNRAPSPASLDIFVDSKPASPFDDPPPRPLSRNPFIDQAPPPVRSPGVMSSHSDSKSLSAEEIFVRVYDASTVNPCTRDSKIVSVNASLGEG